ncbi:MAG: S41 family peptidase [Bacillota bacterium]|nr:S41 family peptidase [Bacillota bacterium]
MISKKKFYIVLSLSLIIIGTLSFFSGVYSCLRESKLVRIESLIKNYFSLDYDENKMIDTAAKGMTASLNDPYSEYFTKEEFSMLLGYLGSSYSGIGIAVYYDQGQGGAVIESVTEGSPAANAGILAHDVILSVDGKNITADTFSSVVYYIRGLSNESLKDNAPMSFKIKRGSEIINLSIKRSTIELSTVEEKPYGDIYYIKLSEFAEKSPDDFKAAIMNAKKYKGLVLDLRNNGGGTVDSLNSIATQLLPKGLLFYTTDVSDKREDDYINDNEYLDIPLVVLINGNTASASEILSGAVKDYKRGLLVGETSYGKGLVQGVFNFPDGSGIKLTIAKYYTPSGAYINKKGIKPDMEIKASNSGTDDQLNYSLDYLKKLIK